MNAGELVRGTVEVPKWIVNIAAPIFTFIVGGSITVVGWGIQGKLEQLSDKASSAISEAAKANSKATDNAFRLTKIESDRYTDSEAAKDFSQMLQTQYQRDLAVQESLRDIDKQISEVHKELAALRARSSVRP